MVWQKEPEIRSGIPGSCCNVEYLYCNLTESGKSHSFIARSNKQWLLNSYIYRHNSEVFVNISALVEIPAFFRYNKQSWRVKLGKRL